MDFHTFGSEWFDLAHPVTLPSTRVARAHETAFWSSCVKGEPANFYGEMGPKTRMKAWREAMVGGVKLGPMKIELMGQTHDIASTNIASNKFLCSNDTPKVEEHADNAAGEKESSSHPDVTMVRPNTGYHVRLVEEETGYVYWDEYFGCMDLPLPKGVWEPKTCRDLGMLSRSTHVEVPFRKFCLAKNDGDTHTFDLSISSTNYDPEWLKVKGLREGLHYLDGVKGHVIFRVRRKPEIEFKDKDANDGWDPDSYLAPHPYKGLESEQCNKLNLPKEDLYPEGEPLSALWEDRALGPSYPTRFERRLYEHDEPTQKDDDGGLLGGRLYYHHILGNSFANNPKSVPQWDFDGRTPIAPPSNEYSLGPTFSMEDTPWINRNPLMNPERLHNFLTKEATSADSFLNGPRKS